MTIRHPTGDAALRQPSWRRASMALLSAAAVSACAIGPAYRAPDADTLKVAGGFISAPPSEAADIARWWDGFNDPILSGLIDQALANNLDIAQAKARWRQARESYVQASAGLWPSMSASAQATRSDPEDRPSVDLFSDGVEARWTLDLFGAARRGAQAGRASAAAANFTLADVRTAIAAEVARNYIDLRTARARIAIARATLAAQTETLEIAGFRAQAGLVSALDVEQARAQQAATAALIPSLTRSEAQARFRLAVLLGEAPGAIDPALAESAAIPAPPIAIANGAPVDLLRRRADVRAAERRLAAAVARIGVAQAQMLPALTLSGGISSSADRLADLNALSLTTLAGSIAQPLFQAGRLRAVAREREAAADEALAAYKSQVLTALEDVENAAVSMSTAQTRVELITTQANAAEAAATLARLQYRSGLIDFQRTLDSERSLLSAQNDLANARNDNAQAVVRLYLALGGGWTPPDSASAPSNAP